MYGKAHILLTSILTAMILICYKYSYIQLKVLSERFFTCVYIRSIFESRTFGHYSSRSHS